MRDVRITLQYRHRQPKINLDSRGIRWTLFTTLEDLDFADDLALVSHTHLHIQEKTSCVNRFAQQIGLNISLKKTKVMTLKHTKSPTYTNKWNKYTRNRRVLISGKHCKI
jgi:hypothetical protein